MNTKIYYIVEVSGLHNDTSRFKIEPFTGYLTESEGYLNVSTYRAANGERIGAKKFDEPSNSIRLDKLGPWYYKVDKIHWIKVTEKFELTEQYVK